MTAINTTWHHIRRSPFQSLVSVLVMSVSFFVICIYLIVAQGMHSILEYFESKPEITIFLKDGLDIHTVEQLQKELSNYPDIREIKFVSKEKALNIYREQNKDNPLLTEMVTASILPASFEVSALNPKTLEEISQNFSSKKDQVDEIIYQKDVIDSLISWTKLIRQAGLIIAMGIGFLSFLIISVVISLKITGRKEEIRISRLLGASKFYVKKPFLLEGSFYGLFGSLIGGSLSIATSVYFFDQINSFFSPIKFISTNINFYLGLLVISIVAGTTIGVLASWWGSSRHIRY